MNEKTFWTAQRKRLIAHGHFSRIESAITPGFPDVDFCLHTGIEGSIELKYRQTAPSRVDTPCFPPPLGLRQQQIVWIHERCRANGRVFVLAGIGGEVFLIRMTVVTVHQFNAWTLTDLRTRNLLDSLSFPEALNQ
jgi:hypothetical protein